MSQLSNSPRQSAIATSLLSWYGKNARPLPWRETRNPYRILVSEIMLQQTQVSRVLQKYPEFLKQFPNFTSLAHARLGDVIRAWSGMGYNNRALCLQRIAQRIVNEYGGRLPSDSDTLQTFPGIGRYTANAIACFAFEQQIAVVDTNVRRVLSRLFPRQVRTMDEWELAEWILPKRKAFHWNQALMELGALRCTVYNPLCATCPLNRFCKSAFRIKKYLKKPWRIKNPVIPDRIYRGRIVTALRKVDHDRSIEASQLLRIIQPGHPKLNRILFSKLIEGLKRDGLIQIIHRHKKLYFSLPT
jgi:A/G-specific adenine glycosylase